MVYEDENTQFCTVVKNSDNGMTLRNDIWGEFFTKRFDGSIDWTGGWRKNLKPGDVIPVFRQKRGNTYAYMTGFDLHRAEEKLRNFINQEKQDAVVTGCVQIPSRMVEGEPKTFVKCWSPVWKEIEFTTNRIDIQRGDRLTLTRTKRTDRPDEYNYFIKENHSVNQIIQNVGINEILKDFSEAERKKLLLVADRIRLGLEK